MNKTCKNCDNNLEGNFCSNCGQTSETHEINFNSIIHEIQHSILHIDKGIIYTSKELFKRPGHTIKDYLQGKRVKHFKPFSYILILSTLYALLIKLFNKSSFFNDFLIGVKNGASDDKKDNSLGLVGDVVGWMANHYAYSTLILIPIISLASYLCFIKTKQNYFKHLILNSFIAGQRTVAFIIILLLSSFIKNETVNDVISIFNIFLGMVFTFWTYYQFFETIKPFYRILLTILSYLIMGVLFLLIVLLIALSGEVIKAF